MSLSIEVNTADVNRYLQAGRDRVAQIVDAVAEAMLEQVRTESQGASRRVAASWLNERDGEDRKIVSDVFFAGWLARGTLPHGPVSAQRLVFEIDGNWLSVTNVAGITADPFDERAIALIEARRQDITDELFAEFA